MLRKIFDRKRAEETAWRIRNGLKPTPMYEGEQPKLPGEKIIFAHRTEVA